MTFERGSETRDPHISVELVKGMAGVSDLIRHLRSHPEDRDVEVLSRQFEVDPQIVRSTLQKLAPLSKPVHANSASSLDKLKNSLIGFWLRVTSKPFLFILISGILQFFCLRQFALLSNSFLGTFSRGFIQSLFLSLLLFWPLLSFFACMRFGKIRYTFLGSLASIIATVAIMLLDNSKTTMAPSSIFAVVFALFFGLMIIGTPILVYGAYRNVRRAQRAYDSMSRQELLDRLLTVRSQLNLAQIHVNKSQSKHERLIAFCEQHIFWISASIAFAISILVTAFFFSFDPERKIIQLKQGTAIPASALNGRIIAASISISALGMAIQVGLGALSKNFKTAIWVIFGYIGGSILADALPYRYFPTIFQKNWTGSNIVSSIPFTVAVIGVGFFLRQIANYTILERRRELRDPVVLANELVELELRLTPNSERICVMAIDVAGSTSMKRGADPLIAEWTFREYQRWVEMTCQPFGGKVHSTAGDGAILGFESVSNALQACRELVNSLQSFNQTVNRMETPFVIRIGIHLGDVQGNLGDVQFTRVIDIAAHLEGHAPKNGIAISQTAYESNPLPEMKKLDLQQDGLDVYVLSFS